MEKSIMNKIPRHMRTPITSAWKVIESADELYCGIIKEEVGYFIEKHVIEFIEDKETDGDLFVEEMRKDSLAMYARDDGEAFLGVLYILFIASAYAVQAVKAYKSRV